MVSKYDENSIQVLKGLSGVRRRPSMYIGDVGEVGFHHMILEVLDNCCDEAVAGFANKITLTVHKDESVTVEDNGRGMPVANHPTEKIPTVDVIMTMLHAGGKFDGGGYKNCFTGDTRIRLLNGEVKTMKWLAENYAEQEFWVISCLSDGTVVPALAKNPCKTKVVNELIEVTLDNGKKERCTLNHKWMLRDGSYKEAKDIVIGESLMSHLDNYKVTDIKIIIVENEPEDMYDIEVPSTRNFVLESGVFVHNSSGLHGVGAAVVNALSDWVEVVVKRDGKKYLRRYENAEPTKKEVKVLEKGLKKKDTGTAVTFKANKNIFKGCSFSQSNIARRLRELSFLNSGIEFVFKWEETGEEQVFLSNDGMKEYVKYLSKNKKPLHKPMVLKTDNVDGCSIEVAFSYDKGYESSIHSFANSVNTVEGGVHYNAALDSLTKVITRVAKSSGLLKKINIEPNKSDVVEGLTLVVKVLVPDPEFGGQTKTKLNNQDLRVPFGEWMLKEFESLLKKNKVLAKTIASKIVESLQARDASRKAKKLSRKKTSLESLALPGKLADCKSKNPEICELFLVEGNSAGGSAKDARDKTFQAILPLRGKVLNVAKASLNKALENKEIGSLITALGVKVTPREVYLDDLRYNKIIIMCDADVDGSHIRTLIMTLFYTYLRRVIDEGKLYTCELPLFKVVHRNKKYYLKDDVALDDFKKQYPDQKMEISRFKGLGEMNPEQLAELAMNPATRKLCQIRIVDDVEASEMTECLMGNDLEGRKKYLMKKLKF